MSESLKKKTLRGAIWTFLEKLGTQGVGFAVTLVLARLLTPGDYGVIGLLTVFMCLSHMFVDSGFGAALIRQRERRDEDYSTVFWYNLAVACGLYAALFFAAPYVARFYRMELLSPILRVLGLDLILSALYTIHVTHLTALVDFKLQAKVSFLASVLSGTTGIAMAAYGFGPWALVAQILTNTAVACAAYWLWTSWHPSVRFSPKAFRRLFGFGVGIVASNFVHTIYQNISPLIIGRKYTKADLGQYARGDSLVAMPGGLFTGTLGRVIFPILASIQDDETRLKAAYARYLHISTSVIAPTMLLIAALGEPLIMLLIGAKWLPCVPYLQLLAAAWMVDPVIQVNLNILYVKGRSDLVLGLEIVKKIIGITIVVVSVQYGIIWLCVGRVAYTMIALVLNLVVCGPFIGMGFWRQLRELAPIYLTAGAAAFAAWKLTTLGLGTIASLALGAGAGFVLYAAAAMLLGFPVVREVKAHLGMISNRGLSKERR